MLTLMLLAVTGSLLVAVCLVALGYYGMWNQTRHELTEAHNRLYAAWKEGAVIPAADLPPSPPAPPLEPELQAFVDEWTSPAVRQGIEDRIRRLRAKKVPTREIARQLLLDTEHERLTTPSNGATRG